MSTSTRRAATGGALALLLGSTILAAPADAAPRPVKCGTVITASTTLTADIGPCSSDGLVIGADNVVLDLGGFAVVGRANRTGDGIGISIPARTNVTVRNGRVTDFDAGVGISGGSNNTVTDLLVKDNIGTTKRGDLGDGIFISGSSGNRIIDNNVIHNGPYDGIALFGVTTGNLIESNVVGGNSLEFTADDGIRIEGPGAANNIIRKNSVTGSTLDGIAVFIGGGLNTGNVIEENTVTANGFGLLAARPGDGIRLFRAANDTIVRNNVVTDNAGSGILVANGALSNDILNNTATGNARQAAAGSRFDLQDDNVACDANVWSGNTFGTASQACTTL